MDEPFAGVDAATESAILKILRELAQNGKTVIVVHHDLQSAAEFFDWIVLLNLRLVACGPIKEVFTKQTSSRHLWGQAHRFWRKLGP